MNQKNFPLLRPINIFKKLSTEKLILSTFFFINRTNLIDEFLVAYRILSDDRDDQLSLGG